MKAARYYMALQGGCTGARCGQFEEVRRHRLAWLIGALRAPASVTRAYSSVG